MNGYLNPNCTSLFTTDMYCNWLLLLRTKSALCFTEGDSKNSKSFGFENLFFSNTLYYSIAKKILRQIISKYIYKIVQTQNLNFRNRDFLIWVVMVLSTVHNTAFPMFVWDFKVVGVKYDHVNEY